MCLDNKNQMGARVPPWGLQPRGAGFGCSPWNHNSTLRHIILRLLLYFETCYNTRKIKAKMDKLIINIKINLYLA